jgi:hypothetical protein
MSRPQLFMQVEPNITGVVTMVTFQKNRFNPCHSKTEIIGVRDTTGNCR